MDCILSFFGLVQPAVVHFYLVLFLGWVVWLLLIWLGRTSFVDDDVRTVLEIQLAEIERVLESLSLRLRCNIIQLISFWFEVEPLFKVFKIHLLGQSRIPIMMVQLLLHFRYNFSPVLNLLASLPILRPCVFPPNLQLLIFLGQYRPRYLPCMRTMDRMILDIGQLQRGVR